MSLTAMVMAWGAQVADVGAAWACRQSYSIPGLSLDPRMC